MVALAANQFVRAEPGSFLGTANVPFPFQIGSQEMPIGVYQIRKVPDHKLLLIGPDGKSHLVATHRKRADEAPAKGYIVFHRFGKTYFLEQVWEAGARYGMECVTSTAENEMLVASNQRVASSIQVTLNTGPVP